MPVACCDSTRLAFTAQTTMVIPWVGDVPTIQVAYQQDGQYVIAEDFLMTVSPTQILLDFGFPATGIVKIIE